MSHRLARRALAVGLAVTALFASAGDVSLAQAPATGLPLVQRDDGRVEAIAPAAVLRLPLAFAPDTDMLEYVCNENPRSRPHLVGRTDQERGAVVAPSIFRRYVGTYRATGPVLLGITEFTVFLDGEQLFVRLNGKGRIPLTPMSDTMFSPRLLGTMQFVSDAAGNVTHVISHAAEGGVRYERRE